MPTGKEYYFRLNEAGVCTPTGHTLNHPTQKLGVCLWMGCDGSALTYVATKNSHLLEMHLLNTEYSSKTFK